MNFNKSHKENFKEKISINNFNKLENLINYIKEIEKEINSLEDTISNYSKQSKRLITDLSKYIINYKNSLNRFIQYENPIESKAEEELCNQVKEYSQKLFTKIFSMYENKYIQNIKKLIEQFEDSVSEIEIFEPPNTNSFSPNISTLLNSDNQKSYEEDYSKHDHKSGFTDFLKDDNLNENEEEEYEENIILNCSICNNNKADSYCEDCNQLFCKKCFSDMVNKNKMKKIKHNTNQIKQNYKAKEIERLFFLNSITQIIKSIIIKGNYLINHEKIKSYNNESKKPIYIKRKFNLPYIKGVNDNNSQKDFLNNINKILKEEFNENNLDIHYFYISEMNTKILDFIKKIFIDQKINIIKESLEIIDFASDEEIDEVYIKEDKEDNYQVNDNEFLEKKNMFYYVINLVSQRDNIIFNKRNIKTVFINQLKDILSINENNIFLSFNNKNYFINSYIKTKEFNSFSLQMIKKYYPGFDQLYEFKIIFDNILKNKKYNDYLDCTGNTICPNSSYNLMRGSEKYNPPYGWFGIGLNVMGKYENNDWLENKTDSSKWAIAYYSVGQSCSSNKIKELINNIITKDGLNKGENQFKCSSQDKRHPNKKIGVGIYLTPDINIAEKFSGKITINNKKYKVVLMARVLIDQIREPPDINFWITSKQYIRLYRILVKEVF